MKPRIGITANTMIMKDFFFPGMKRPYVNQDYIDTLESAGAAPFLLPPMHDLSVVDPLLEACDGLLFSGGDDIHPSFYQQEMREKIGPTYSKTDRFQIEVCRIAVEKEIPFLGICRGQQILNVARGGTLFQDLSEISGTTLKHFQAGERSDTAHAVTIEDDSLLAAIFQEKEIFVNSFHHQSVDRLGRGLKIVATSHDGVVEALELEHHPFGLSVQWHPEMMMTGNNSMRPLFDAFIQACFKS